MKIKFSKDYQCMKSTYDRDKRNLGSGGSITLFSDYSGTWEEAEVTFEQLKEYVKRGYAIKINY